MTSGSDWQGRVGQTWAEEWRRTDRSFAELTQLLLTAIGTQRGTRILDIGCGAGELSLALAAARPDAEVTGLDISADLVATASERAAELGTPRVRFRHGDAGEYADPHGAPDLLVSRHGVMFFADPPATFAHLARVSAPDAVLVFSCFRARPANPWADLFDAVLPPLPPAPQPAFAPGPFAFADLAHAKHCLAGHADAGWHRVQAVPANFSYVAGSGDDPVADAIAFFQRIGPAAARLALVPREDRPAALAAMAGVLQNHCHDGKVTVPAAAWIITAHRRSA